MPQTLLEPTPAFVLDDEARLAIERLVEADDPVDNPFAEVPQHFLFEAIKSSYVPPPDRARPGVKRKFWGASNVGLFKNKTTFLIPDMFLSLDVERPDWLVERAYYLFEHKPPEVVVEVVSNDEGNELGTKKATYAEWGIQHYVVYDPGQFLGAQVLHAFSLEGGRFVHMDVPFFPNLGVGVTLWKGVYTDKEETYLRWCDERGVPLGIGDEKAVMNARRADAEAARADLAEMRAAGERARAEALRAILLKHGIDPGM